MYRTCVNIKSSPMCVAPLRSDLQVVMCAGTPGKKSKTIGGYRIPAPPI